MATVALSLLPASLSATVLALVPTLPLRTVLTCTLAQTVSVFETLVVLGTSTMARVTSRRIASARRVQAGLWPLMLFSVTLTVKSIVVLRVGSSSTVSTSLLVHDQSRES